MAKKELPGETGWTTTPKRGKMPDAEYGKLLLRLVKELGEIKLSLRRSATTLPLYDVANENTPATLTASQNNYDIGNYDVLRISSTLAISITGFLGGVKGRSLLVFNVGSYAITFSNNSASSLSANKINTDSGADIVVDANGYAEFYYDSTISKWRSTGNS